MELEQLPEIQKIIHIGKANGEITYDEINDILPEKLTNSDKIDDVFILLNQYGIEIVEEYEKKQVGRRGDTDDQARRRDQAVIGAQYSRPKPAYAFDEMIFLVKGAHG